jgi:hypothetical protein
MSTVPGRREADLNGHLWPISGIGRHLLLQPVLFQLAEEIGFTDLQHNWQYRYHPMSSLVRSTAVGGVAPVGPIRQRTLVSCGVFAIEFVTSQGRIRTLPGHQRRDHDQQSAQDLGG